MSYRPTVTKVQRYNWLNKHDKTPGIALRDDYGVRAHLTPAEALRVANDIADVLQEMNHNDDA